MTHDRLIIAIGRIERTFSRLEKLDMQAPLTNESGLLAKHETLKAAARDAIREIDALIGEEAN